MSAFIIKGGLVYDPATRQLTKADISVEDGVIVRETTRADDRIIDAEGCIVTTGLIDYHVHYFNHGTENGVNPDAASFPCGITTAVDAGSCGAANYELYRNTVMALSDVRIFNALLIASGGQVTDRYPEQLQVQHFDIPKIKKLFKKYPDNLVGLKTRMSEGIINPDEAEASLAATVKLAGEIGCRVIVHITKPVLGLEKLTAMLRKGDVVCHAFQGLGRETILDQAGQVRACIREAAKRGILFDASNGRSNYDLTVCQKAVAQGFYPDIISSDNNTSSFYLQPLHSLPRILSKYLDMGMSLEQVLATATINPARALGREELASLAEGTVADLAIFKLVKKDVGYVDVSGHTFQGHQVLVPQLTMKSGKVMYCQADFG